jgi:hypothetical protein
VADLVIPNTFSPNTPAKSEEVNANFAAVATHVNLPPPTLPTSGVFLVRNQELFTNSPTWTTDATTDMFINNIPVVAGHTYGIWLQVNVEWASLAAGARWDVYTRINGADHRRLAIIQPISAGVSYWPLDVTVLWRPTVTRATDDLTIRVDEITNGADISFVGSATSPRTLAVFDYGVAV